MMSTSRARDIRWGVCVALVSGLALWVLAGGCPKLPTDGNTDPNASNTDPNASNGGNTDPNASNGGNTDPNSSNGGNTDPNSSNGGNTDPNSSNGGNTDPNSSNGGHTIPPPPTSLSVAEIARTHSTAVPGQPAAVSFTAFGNPVLDAEGRVAFWATYAGTGAVGGSGLFVWDNELKVAVNDDPNTAGIVPNRTPASYFGAKGTDFRPLDQGVVWGAGNRLLFASSVTSNTQGDAGTRGLYRWRATDGNIVRIADREQVLTFFPDTFSNGFDQTFVLPGVGDAGQAVFGITYTYITNDPNHPSFVSGQGVFTSDGTNIQMLVDTVHSKKTPGGVPEQGTDVYFGGVQASTAISPNGDVLLQGGYQNKTGTVSGTGVYLGRSGKLYRVIDSRASASWPGLTSGAQLSTDTYPYRLSVGPAGDIALGMAFVTGDTPQDAVLLWDWDVSKWTEVTDANGTPVVTLLSGVNDLGQTVVLSADGSPYMASRTARTRLDATLPTQLQGAGITWADNGGSISNYNRAVLPYSYADGKKGLAFWTGAQLLVMADAKLGTPTGLQSIQTESTPERDRPGRSGLLNDSDEAVFRGLLDANEQVIYMAQGH